MAYKTKTITVTSETNYVTNYRRVEHYRWTSWSGTERSTEYSRTSNGFAPGINFDDFTDPTYVSNWAYTWYTAIVLSGLANDLIHDNPAAAGEEQLEIKIDIDDSKLGTDCILFAANSVLNSAQNVFLAYSENGTYLAEAAKGSTTINATVTDKKIIQNIKTYGIIVAPARIATPYDADKYDGRATKNSTRINFLQSYQNPATPGKITPISPSSHGVLITNKDNIITYKYTQEYGYAMAYLGLKITSLETGAVKEIKKYAATVASGGTGTYTIPAGTLAEGTYRFDFSGMTAAAPTYYPDSSPEWLSGTSAEFTVKTNPEASSVTCDGKPVPPSHGSPVDRRRSG